jgi:hypothetical protein
MPDIREILNALDVDDRALWSEQRTIMRRSYLNAHNETVGMSNWMLEDDAFLDLIDIRLALLFDRAGKLHTVKEIIGNGNKIEDDIKASEDKMKEKAVPAKVFEANKAEVAESEATKILNEGFAAPAWPKKQDKE